MFQNTSIQEPNPTTYLYVHDPLDAHVALYSQTKDLILSMRKAELDVKKLRPILEALNAKDRGRERELDEAVARAKLAEARLIRVNLKIRAVELLEQEQR